MCVTQRHLFKIIHDVSGDKTVVTMRIVLYPRQVRMGCNVITLTNVSRNVPYVS